MNRGNGIHSSKAQAAMEFLMTYGWALLVVLVAIGALAFFGVLNPGQFLPDQCTMFSGVSCISYYATVGGAPANSLTLTFQNGLGYAMSMAQASCASCGVNVDVTGAGAGPTALTDNVVGTNDCATTGAAQAISIADGGTLKCTYNLPGGTIAKTRLKGTITMTWKEGSATGNLRTRTGNLAVTVES